MKKYTRLIIKTGLLTALVLALSAVLIIGAGASPIKAIHFFVYGIFGNLNGFGEIFVKATPLVLCGLGIAVGMRSGFFNIGADGQIYIGALAAAIVTLIPLHVPGVVKIILAMICSFFAGGIWSFIAGYLKARFQVSEIIVTLMLNYIAYDLVGALIRGALMDKTDFLPQSPKLNVSLSQIFPPTRLHTGFIIAAMSVVLIWFVMDHTSVGYELQVVGANARAARVAGINIFGAILIASLLSGGLAGIAGASELLGLHSRLLEGISGGTGYTAILVALLGKNKPLRIFFIALGFAALQVGANTMQRQLGVPSSIVLIITGFIVILLLFDDVINRIVGYSDVKEAA